MERFATLLRAGLRELYRKPFSEVEHPRGDDDNAGHFRKKDDAAPSKAADDDGDDPLASFPKPADIKAGIKDNAYSHGGYTARVVPARGMADSWSVMLKHPDGRETEHEFEDRRGRQSRDAAVRGIHGLLKAHVLAAVKPKKKAPEPAAEAPSEVDAFELAMQRRDAELKARKAAAEPTEPKKPATGGGLFGDVELPKMDTAWTPPRYAPGERPAGVRMLPGGLWTGPATLHKDDLAVDPTRFQYKIAGIDSRTGVTKELKGVAKYNPLLGGQLLVWHDPEDGRTYVVNGHHRAELAKRSGDWDADESGPGWHGELQAFYIPAKTAQEARAWGALANIAEGRGTATDAAKFMRDTGASADGLKSRGISMSGRITQDATDLAGLSDGVFQSLANGRITENRALAIARHVKDPAMQDTLFQLIQKREREEGEEVTDSEIAEVARALELAGTTKVKGGKQGGMLFGDDDEWDEPLLWQRAAVTSAIRRGLTTERNVFKAVSTDNRVKRITEVGGNTLDVDANKNRAQSATEALYLFDKLANSKGELSQLLHRHAERIFHEPHNRKRIIEDAKREAIDVLGRSWGGPSDGDGRGGQSGGAAREGYSRTAAGRRGSDGSSRVPGCGQVRFLTLVSALAPHAVQSLRYSLGEHNVAKDTDVAVEAVTETGGKISKIDAGYRPAPSPARCGRCEHYRSGRCSTVAGDIDEFNTCDLWRPGGDETPQVFAVEQLEHYSRSPGSTFASVVNAFNRQIMQGMGIPREHYAGHAKPAPGQMGLPMGGGAPANWDETKHPRNHGQFASKGGGAPAGPAAPAAAKPAAKPAEPPAPFALKSPAPKPHAAPPPDFSGQPAHQTTLWHGMNDLPGQKKLFGGMDLGGKPPASESSSGAPATPKPPAGQSGQSPPASQPSQLSQPSDDSAKLPPSDPAVAKAPEAAQASPVVPPDIKAAAGVAAPHTPPPPGEMYAPNPAPKQPGQVAEAARVGVPGNVVPPPPATIPRLPNLTEHERHHETQFAQAFESDPDGMADRMISEMAAGRLGEAPNMFGTDDAKMLYDDWRGTSTVGPNGKPVLSPETLSFRSTMNTALHQTANAVAKRAFLRYLDNVVMKQPEGQRHVLATAGGVAAGKGYALGKIAQMNDLQHSASATWDSAGEQNSTELPWLADECAKRGIRMTAVFVNANPQEVWATPKGGVIERAGNKGRMVDARAFADSYTHGARNFHSFAQQHANNPMVATAVIDNPRGSDQQQLPGVPQQVLAMDPEQLYATCLQQLSTSPQATPAIKAGGAAGVRIWGPPQARPQ